MHNVREENLITWAAPEELSLVGETFASLGEHTRRATTASGGYLEKLAEILFLNASLLWENLPSDFPFNYWPPVSATSSRLADDTSTKPPTAYLLPLMPLSGEILAIVGSILFIQQTTQFVHQRLKSASSKCSSFAQRSTFFNYILVVVDTKSGSGSACGRRVLRTCKTDGSRQLSCHQSPVNVYRPVKKSEANRWASSRQGQERKLHLTILVFVCSVLWLPFRSKSSHRMTLKEASLGWKIFGFKFEFWRQIEFEK